MLDVLVIILVIALILWVVAQFVPSGQLGAFALAVWLIVATVILAGGRLATV